MPFTGIKYEKIAFCSSVSSTSGRFCFSSFPRSTGVSTCGICTVFPFQEERSVFLLTKANSSSLSCASVGFCGRSAIGTSSKSFFFVSVSVSISSTPRFSFKFWSSSVISDVSSAAFCAAASVFFFCWERTISSKDTPSGQSSSASVSLAGCSSFLFSSSSSFRSSGSFVAGGVSLSGVCGGVSVVSSTISAFSASTASSFGNTPVRRSIISPASCSARALADSSFRFLASSSAASAALRIFSHSLSTSSIVIWPVI
ncbi:unknown [Roseburia sp. CAG:18]|nr:unknown [Roseburia sp. CAG:18]